MKRLRSCDRVLSGSMGLIIIGVWSKVQEILQLASILLRENLFLKI